MNETIYSFSLVALLSLMFFMGFSLMFMHLPENKKSRSFLQSCRLMGAALIVLAINCTLHLVFSIRMRDSVIAILVNLSTYFICYWLFSCALMTLLDKTYLTRKRFLYHFVLWLLFLTVSTLLIFIPDGSFTRIGIVVLLAFCLIAYGVFLAARLLKTYHKSLRLFENTHSDDIGSYIRWLSIFTYLAILFGISCGILTFLPDRFVFIWLLSAALFCIYLYRCYQNYIFFYDRVEDALMEDEEDMSSEPVDEPQLATEAVPSIPEYHSDLSRRISEWIEGKGYTRPGITLNDLSSALGTIVPIFPNISTLSSGSLSVTGSRTCGLTMRKASWTAILRQGYRRFPRHQVSFPSAIFPELSAKGKVVLLRNGARTGRQGSDYLLILQNLMSL